MHSKYYLTRVTWNETHSVTNEDGTEGIEEYKTYLIGGSVVGVPEFRYGRTPFASWGVTPRETHSVDLFVEDVWEDASTYFDTITG